MLTFFKPFALFLFLSATQSLSVKAQSWQPPAKPARPIDSAAYYQKIMGSLVKGALDSIRQSEAYKDAMEKYRHHVSSSNAYTAFTLFGDVGRANYDVINAGTAQSGFPALKGPQYRIGFGITSEYSDRMIFEFYFFTFGISNKVQKGDSTIKATYSNLVQYNFGYDLVPSKKINIYPYAGLAFRITTLEYKQPDQVNNNYTSIVDLVMKDGRTLGNKFNLSYQAGVGFDLVLHESEKGVGTMLFARAGTDGIIGTRDFKIKGIKYHTNIQQGAWQLALGFKFFTRM